MAHQVFVTHCLQNDSVKNQTGYGIRATSTKDAELLKFAAEYPAYELPLEMQANEPTPAQAPRRLAMLPMRPGVIALIHSAYVGEDTMGRTGNFFSHIVFYPALTAVQALESWGAREWRTSYPIGAAKELDELSDQPFVGDSIGLESLSQFLAGNGAAKDQNLATLTCPARLLNEPGRCQALQAKMLDAVLAALDGGAARGRLYLVGEPGLIAMLLYGAARLLPKDGPAKMSFSTFENPKALRQLRLTFASATYTSDPHRGLDADYFQSRGFGFDAMPPDRCSHELAAKVSTEASELVRLAAENQWPSIDRLHEYHFASQVSSTSLRSSFKMYNSRNKAKKGQLTAEELIDLHASADGERLIQKEDAIFWPLIIRHGMASDAVRDDFAAMFRTRADELVGAAGNFLGSTDPQWANYWELLTQVKAVDERRMGMLMKYAAQKDPRRAHLAKFRLPLLREWKQVSKATSSIAQPIRDLLALTSPEEYASLQKLGVPSDWLAYSLDQGLSASPAATWIADAVNNAPAKVQQSFCAQLNLGKSYDDLLRKLKFLVPDAESYPVLLRLAQSGLLLPPEAVRALMESFGDFHAQLSPIWLRDDHVETILTCMASFKERAQPIWNQFCRFINKELLFGNPDQKVLLENLMRSRPRCKGSLSSGCAQLLDDWTLLLQLFQNPGATPVRREEIEAACRRRRLHEPGLVLGEYFQRLVVDKPIDSAPMAAFATTFECLYPTSDSMDAQMTRFGEWNGLLDGIQDKKKIAEFHLYFLDKLVPMRFRLSLAENQADVIDKRVVDRIRKSVAVQTPPVAVHAKSAPAAAVTRAADAEPPRRNYRYYLDLGLALVLGMGLGALCLFLFHVISLNNEVRDLRVNKLALNEKISKAEQDAAKIKKDFEEELRKQKESRDFDANKARIMLAAAKETFESDLRAEKNKTRTANETVGILISEKSDLKRQLDELSTKFKLLATKVPPRENPTPLYIADVLSKPGKPKLFEKGRWTKNAVLRLEFVENGPSTPYFREGSEDNDKRCQLVMPHTSRPPEFLFNVELTSEQNETMLVIKSQPKLPSNVNEAVKHLDEVMLVIREKNEQRYYKFVNEPESDREKAPSK